MARPFIVLGGCILILAAGRAWGATTSSAGAGLRCRRSETHRCGDASGAGTKAAAKVPAIDFALNSGWQAPAFHATIGREWRPADPAVPASATGAGAGANENSFSPGQSTAEGQHLVEWTLLAAPVAAFALSPLLDHRLAHVDTGIWKRSRQLTFEHIVIATELGGALWLGGKSRLGKTFWRAVDSSLYTAATVQAMKYAFSRSRPYQANNPNLWFQGNCCQSFPSGEVSFQASFVTPFIAEYYKQDPWIWSLEVLPAYDALARMKAQGHWQTDVLAAWAIGTAWGLYAHFEPKPLVLSVMPDGIAVGLHVHF